jgi:hypothetical protein
LKGSKLYRIRNMKAGRKFIIAAAAFAALAVPATANAATVDLTVVSGPTMSETANNTNGDNYYTTKVIFEASNGWHPTTNCTSSNELDSNGDSWGAYYTSQGIAFKKSHTFTKVIGQPSQIRGIWKTSSNDYVDAGYLGSATISCAMTKAGTTIKTTHPLVWKTFTKHRSGTNPTSTSHSSSCYINRTYSLGLHLDCWGGAYAQANYHFALPSDARNISRNISTEAGCCSYSSGSNSKSWVGNTAIVRTSGWHSMYVHGATIRYQHRVRVTKRTRVPVTLHATGIGQF